MIWRSLSILTGAYLLGSLPFSYVVARLFGISDVRAVGSGNVGATNVARTAGRPAGAIAFLLDASKGALAVLLAGQLGASPSVLAAVAAAAVVGHMYPVWLGFRGGKGVATGAGAFLPLVPLATAVGVAAFLAVALSLKRVSLGSIAGALALAAATFVLAVDVAVFWSALGVAALVIVRHRGNLRSLLREPRGTP